MINSNYQLNHTTTQYIKFALLVLKFAVKVINNPFKAFNWTQGSYDLYVDTVALGNNTLTTIADNICSFSGLVASFLR